MGPAVPHPAGGPAGALISCLSEHFRPRRLHSVWWFFSSTDSVLLCHAPQVHVHHHDQPVRLAPAAAARAGARGGDAQPGHQLQCAHLQVGPSGCLRSSCFFSSRHNTGQSGAQAGAYQNAFWQLLPFMQRSGRGSTTRASDGSRVVPGVDAESRLCFVACSLCPAAH